jgi:predicted PurR-regulated permease PerM
LHIEKKTLQKIFLGVGGCIVLYWFLHETEQVDRFLTLLGNIFSPFILGAGVAFVMNVPMRSIENRLVRIKNENTRRILAVLGTLAVILLVLALVFYLLIPQVIDTAKTVALKLPDFFNNLWIKFMAFLQARPELLEWVMANTSLESFNIGAILEKVLNVVGNSVSTIVTGAFTAIGGNAAKITYTAIMPAKILFNLSFIFYSFHHKVSF